MGVSNGRERASAAPKRQGLVLATLILVAAVANLNLAVANVALPDIGKAFDASQTSLNLVAVGYSLGLATSVLYFGAIGDRYGRKTMLIIGTGLAIPASILAAFSPTIEILFVARVPRRTRRRHGLPDHARADHRALVGPGPDQVDRAVVRTRRSDLGARAADLGRAADRVRLGIGIPGDDSAGADRTGHGREADPRPTSTRPPTRSTTWAACSRS